MKSYLCIVAAGALAVALFAEETKAPQPTRLSVRLTKVDVTDLHFLIELEVKNVTEKPLQMWDLSSDPGRESAAFMFPDSMGGLVRVFRKENQQDSGGTPKIITLSPKCAKRWSFNLFDRTWQVPGHVGSGTTDLVRVEVSAPATEAAQRGEVWAGTITSEVIQMNKTLAQIWTAQAIPFTSKVTK
jgi:hypothetical protein